MPALSPSKKGVPDMPIPELPDARLRQAISLVCSAIHQVPTLDLLTLRALADQEAERRRGVAKGWLSLARRVSMSPHDWVKHFSR